MKAHEDDIALASRLYEAHTQLMKLAHEFEEATDLAYDDAYKDERNFLICLTRARTRKEALAKLTPVEREAFQ